MLLRSRPAFVATSSNEVGTPRPIGANHTYGGAPSLVNAFCCPASYAFLQIGRSGNALHRAILASLLNTWDHAGTVTVPVRPACEFMQTDRSPERRQLASLLTPR